MYRAGEASCVYMDERHGLIRQPEKFIHISYTVLETHDLMN